MINVTQTFLPPYEEYEKHISRAWKKNWIANHGELVLELEEKLKKYFNLSNVVITNNGTIPLQIALKILGNNGEIITTPFSYVASTSAIVWENCTPVFVDIHPEYLTIDETKIESAITKKTTAILATHVFGNPCNIEAIETIAKKHNLKVIYDGAHSFGVNYKGNSIFCYGDVSTCSFHATKLFHTGEGGAMFTSNSDLQHQLYYSHNFGHNGSTEFFGLGINAKMNELQAAMGLAVFPYLDKIINDRKKVVDFYNSELDFSKLRTIQLRDQTIWNYSYYPVIFQNESQLIRVVKALNNKEIKPRRYFYPSLNTLNYVDYKKMPVSESIASTVLCLPLYSGLKAYQLEEICAIINSELL